MKRYYGHQNLCYISNWSGHEGARIELSYWQYFLLELLGFRTTVEMEGDLDRNPLSTSSFVLRLIHM